MVTILNQYVAKLKLLSDDLTKNILQAALQNHENIKSSNVLIKSQRYIVDIKLTNFSVENATAIMNHFMEQTRFHYSALYVRFNEGNLIRYRYASSKENGEGFYCDVIISK